VSVEYREEKEVNNMSMDDKEITIRGYLSLYLDKILADDDKHCERIGHGYSMSGSLWKEKTWLDKKRDRGSAFFVP
jgi:hypothetical protein